MRFLLLGGTGQVGTELRALALSDNIEVAAPDRGELDLQDESAIARMIALEPWSAVVNAAAYTDVDRAESEEAVAFAVNAAAPSRLADETGRRGIPLVHISTDYVFDGRKGAPYVEQDSVAPLNAYGRSKLAGERGVCAGNPRHVVLRTSWIYSPYGRNFVKTILRLAGEREHLTVVADQRGCPTAARDIARACLDIALRCVSEPEHTPYGVYHFAGAGDASWFEFASKIVEMAADRLARSPPVLPIRTIDYPTPEPRPWRRALAETIDRLLTNKDHP